MNYFVNKKLEVLGDKSFYKGWQNFQCYVFKYKNRILVSCLPSCCSTSCDIVKYIYKNKIKEVNDLLLLMAATDVESFKTICKKEEYYKQDRVELLKFLEEFAKPVHNERFNDKLKSVLK